MAWDAEATFRRADEAIARGEPWRAREIYQGCVRSQEFDQRLYRRYAELLLQLGDRLEAGKYCFLAGWWDGEAGQAAKLFLDRHRGSGPRAVFDAFPGQAKLPLREDYPPQLAAELEQLGLPERLLPPETVQDWAIEKTPAFWLMSAGCWIVGIFCLLALVVGTITIYHLGLRKLAELVVG